MNVGSVVFLIVFVMFAFGYGVVIQPNAPNIRFTGVVDKISSTTGLKLFR